MWQFTPKNNSLLGEISLNGWSPVLQVWIQLLHYIRKTTYFLCWSSPVLLNWRPAVKWSFPQRWVFSGKSIDNKLPYDMSNSLDYTALTYGSVRASVTRWWNKKRPNFPQIAQKIGTHLLHNSDSITNNPKSHKNIWATVVRQFVAANS